MLELGLQTSSDRIVTRCFISTLALKCQDSRCLEQLLFNLLLHSCLLGKYFKFCKQSGKTHWYGNAKLPYVMFFHNGVKERNSLSWSMGKKGKSVTRRWAGFKRKEDKPRTEGTDYQLHSHLRTKANNIQHNSSSPRFCGGGGGDLGLFFFFWHLSFPNHDQIDECHPSTCL